MRRYAIAGLLFLFLTSCMAGIEKPVAPVVPQDTNKENGLTNARSSIEELCKEVLAGIAGKDRKLLETMALTEDELKRYIWPYSEWSKPEVRMPFEFYRGDLHQKSSFALSGVLAKYGGIKFEFVSARFAKDILTYQNARVHNGARITVRDEQGRVGEIKMFGSVFELNGQYKIFSYK